MATIGGVELDIELAARRLSIDLRDDWFPDPLHFRDRLTNQDMLLGSFRADNYRPSAATEINVPKPGYTVRYSLEQAVDDRLIYQAIADSLQHLDSWLRFNVFGYRLQSHTGTKMFQSKVQSWLSFNGTIRTRLSDTNGVLLVADVQNYFEGITHLNLYETLRTLDGTIQPILDLLSRALHVWCRGGAGIPQNRDASSFLANLYLAPVDREMVDAGYEYYRYMDDMRVICRDKYHARRALLHLIASLRSLNLNVNAKKTKILTSDAVELSEFVPTRDEVIERFDALVRSGCSYLVVEPMIQHLVGIVQRNEIDTRAFRAALERVKRIASSRYASQLNWNDLPRMLVNLLVDHPWHTDIVVELLRILPLTDDDIGVLCSLVTDPATYPYAWQSYHIWMLLASRGDCLSRLRAAAWDQAEQSSQEGVARAAGAIIYLGACGDGDDRVRLARLMSQYSPHRAIRRALVIATQEVDGYSAERYLANLSEEEDSLRTYLRSGVQPTYTSRAERTTLWSLGALRDEY